MALMCSESHKSVRNVAVLSFTHYNIICILYFYNIIFPHINIEYDIINQI